MPEMARLLGISRKDVYNILQGRYRHFFEFVTIADRRRITKESFERFLDGQSEYRLDPKNDYAEVALEENTRLANYRRRKISEQHGLRRGNGNQEYLTIPEAVLLANVTRATVEWWIRREYFPVRRAGNIVRIPRAEFESWLENRKEANQDGINS